MYFPFFKPQAGNKRFAAQPQTIYSEFPYVSRPFSWDSLQLSFRLSQQGGGTPGMAQSNGNGIRRIVRLGQG